MMIDFAELLEDLELKRATALPADARPPIDVEAALAGLGHDLPILLTAEDGGDAPLVAADAGRIAADAVAALAVAHGEREADTAASRAIVRAATARVLDRLAADGATRLTVSDLSALLEVALIDAGHYEVAKALVMRRADPNGLAPDNTASTGALRLVRRTGDVVEWNPAKIEVAIRKAFLSLQADPDPATALTARVDERVGSLGQAYVPIETVQDIVQEELVLAGHMRVAERYIVYRAERAMLRAQQSTDTPREAPRRSRCSRRTAARRRGTARTCGCASRSRRSASTTSRSSATSWSGSCAGRSVPACAVPTCRSWSS